MCISQAQKVLKRWQPWWHTPEAAALRLTEHGTAPLAVLNDRDRLGREATAVQSSAPLSTESAAKSGPGAGPPAPNAPSTTLTHGLKAESLEASEASTTDERPILPDPPDVPVPKLPPTASCKPSPLIRSACTSICDCPRAPEAASASVIPPLHPEWQACHALLPFLWPRLKTPLHELCQVRSCRVAGGVYSRFCTGMPLRYAYMVVIGDRTLPLLPR